MDEYDVVVVGASIAGCAAATLLGRAGARVALVERSPDPAAYKTVCTTVIQASATPVFERLGLTAALEAAGARRNGGRYWSPWGWTEAEHAGDYTGQRHGWNLRREVLDPLLRATAAETPGVDLLLGRAVVALERDGTRARGARVRDRHGDERVLRARVVVGADGRESRVARLAGIRGRRVPNGRAGYFAHYRGVRLAGDAANLVWFLDPDIAYAFRMDGDVTILAAFPVQERAGAWRAEPERAMLALLAGVADPPDVTNAVRVSKVIAKLDASCITRPAARDGVALVGDAAMTADPAWGVGCGFALQSAEWLADTIAGAVVAGTDAEVDAALRGYARRHRRRLGGHQALLNDFARGRPMNPLERTLFAAAARDNDVARAMWGLGSRQVGVTRTMTPALLARAVAVNVRHRLRGGSAEPPGADVVPIAPYQSLSARQSSRSTAPAMCRSTAGSPPA